MMITISVVEVPLEGAGTREGTFGSCPEAGQTGRFKQAERKPDL